MINYLIITAELQKKFRALNLRLLFLMGMVISLNSDAQVTFAPCIDTTIFLGATTGLYCACDEHEFTGPGVVQIGQDYIFNSNLTGVGVFQVVSACALANPVITITVVPAVIVTINGSQSPQAINICGGSSVNLLGSMIGGGAPYTYSWSPAIGLSNPNGLITSAAPLTTTTYTLTVTSNGGCVDQASITINVTSYPLDITANDQTICQGQSVVLNYTGGIIGQYQIAFSTGNSAIPFGSYYTHTPTQTTTYTLSLTGTTCEISDQVTVQVFPQPTIALNNTPATNGQCNGSVTATVTYSGTASNLVYNWTYNGTLMTGVTTSSINNCCAGTYACTVTGLNGCSAASTTTVQNLNVPAYTITTGNDICNVGCGGTVAFNSQTPFTIQWNAPLSGNTANLEGVCAGTYAATVTFTGYNPFNISFTVVEATGTPLGPINGPYPINSLVIASGDVVINNGGTLNINQCGTLVVYGDIIVEAGGKLDLFLGTIKMQSDKKIVIKTGALLESEYGTFTSACSQQFWRGIEVWGNGTLSQTPINQGRADIQKNTVIERAHVALRMGRSTSTNYEYSGTGGGIVSASQITFKNNCRDVQFIKYYPSNLPSDNLSKFTACNFLVDQNAYFTSGANGSMKSRIQMSQVNSVEFLGCMVNNTHPTWVDLFSAVAGVQANQSLFIWTATSFEGSSYITSIAGLALGMTLSNSYFTSGHKIQDCTFRCYRGINLTAIGNASVIKNNSFYSYGTNSGFPNVPTPFLDVFYFDSYINYINSLSDNNAKNSYCIYMSSPVGVVDIVDNYFNLVGPANVFRVGLFVNANGNLSNDIKGNYFGNMTHGCYFYNANRNSQFGLQFSCNQFQSNGRDININKKPGTAINADNSNFGVKPNLNAGSNISLGNNFSGSLSVVETDDMLNAIGMQSHTYVYASGELVPSEVSTSMNASTSGIAYPQSCPFDYTGSAAPELEDKMEAYNDLKALYELMLDGGNTPATIENIQDAQYAVAFDLYNELMAKSPALSREVMIEAIQKETELPAVLLTAILVANPSAAKDAVIQQELDNRSSQLTNYQRGLIDQGLNLLSSKENLESEMANLMTSFSQLLVYEYQRIATDDAIADKQAAWESLMSIGTDANSLWTRTMWLAGQNRYTEAHTVGTQAVALLRPRATCKEDWTEYLTLLQTLTAWSANEAFALTTTQEQAVQEQIDEAKPATKGLILQTINQYGSGEYELATSYPIDEHGLRSMQFGEEETMPAWLTIFPNPVSEYFVVQLANAPTSTDAHYTVTDITGRMVAKGDFDANNQQVVVDSSWWNTGIYVFTIFDSGQTLHVSKISKE